MQMMAGLRLNQLLFADDTALVADPEEKLCRLVSEFGRVCERRKLRVNVGKGNVIRCSRYSNGGPMQVILNSKPLEEVIVLLHQYVKDRKEWGPLVPM